MASFPTASDPPVGHGDGATGASAPARAARTAATHGNRPATTRQPGPARVCAEAECDTSLSRYHRDERCAKHGGWRDPGDRPHPSA